MEGRWSKGFTKNKQGEDFSTVLLTINFQSASARLKGASFKSCSSNFFQTL